MAEQQHYGIVLVELVKASDRIPIPLLINSARTQGLNLHIAGLSAAAYLDEKRIAIAGRILMPWTLVGGLPLASSTPLTKPSLILSGPPVTTEATSSNERERLQTAYNLATLFPQLQAPAVQESALPLTLPKKQ